MRRHRRNQPVPTKFTTTDAARLVASFIAGLGAFSGMLPHLALAADEHWTQPAAGNFNAADSWNNGIGPVPQTSDTALFDAINNLYAVTFNANPTNAAMAVRTGSVHFETDNIPRAYTVTGTATIATADLTLSGATAPLQINAGTLTVGAGGRLFIRDGNQASASSGNLATDVAGAAAILVDGIGSTFNTGSFGMGSNGGVASLTFQNNANGSIGAMTMTSTAISGSASNFIVQSGAAVTSYGDITIGAGAVTGQASTFLVSDTGSSFQQQSASSFTLGSNANSTASLTVTNGASLMTGTGLTTINRTGSITIGDGGTFISGGDMILDGGTMTCSAIGSFSFLAPPLHTFTARNNAHVGFEGSFNITNSNAYIFQGGAHLSTGLFLDIGNQGNGTLVVDGAETTIEATNISYWGASGGSASVTLSNGATVNMEDVEMATQPAIGTTSANILVGSGSHLSFGYLLIAAGTASSTHATVTVTGTGSTITQIGFNPLILGGDAGSAVLHVDNGGAFTTGTDTITIGKGGTLSINGGTYNANGHITMNGGKFECLNAGTFNLAESRNFTANMSAIIHFDSSYAIVGGSTFTLNSGSNFTLDSYLDVGNGSVGTLVVDNASVAITGIPSYWGADGGTGTISLHNAASVTMNSELDIAVGPVDHTTGTLVVDSASTLSVNTITIAVGGGTLTQGSVTVTGTGSTITQNSGILTMGAATGSAQLTIGPGAVFNAASGITINRTGTLTIAGSLFAGDSDILVNGGTLEVTTGQLSMRAGRTLTAQNGGLVRFESPYTLNQQNTVGILSGASLLATSDFFVSDNGVADLLVDGSASSFSVGGDLHAGNLSGAGTITIRNNATASVAGALLLGIAGPVSGNLTVESGGALAIGNLFIASAGGSATGTLTVTGTGSSITQRGSTSITLGDLSSTAAAIKVNAGAIFTSGTDLIAVRSHGIISINDGTFKANANIHVFTGGAVSLAGADNAWSGTLDITTKALIVDNANAASKNITLATLANQIISGKNGGLWNGNGITSSSNTVDAALNFTLALIDNADLNLASYAGEPVDGNSVIVTRALLGDADLSGTVDLIDFDRWFAHLGFHTRSFVAGDFNTDGIVDLLDFDIWFSHLGFNEFDLLPRDGAVPEPASLGMLAIGSTLMLTHRKRRR